MSGGGHIDEDLDEILDSETEGEASSDIAVLVVAPDEIQAESNSCVPREGEEKKREEKSKRRSDTMWTRERGSRAGLLLLTVSFLVGSGEGFVVTPAGFKAARHATSCGAKSRVGEAGSHRRLGISSILRASAAEWAEAYREAGLTPRSTGHQQLPAEDIASLLASAMAGEPRRKDTFAEVGGGLGLAMATACAEYDFGQAALFVGEEDVVAAEKALEASIKMNSAFDRCQITPGNVQDSESPHQSRPHHGNLESLGPAAPEFVKVLTPSVGFKFKCVLCWGAWPPRGQAALDQF